MIGVKATTVALLSGRSEPGAKQEEAFEAKYRVWSEATVADRD